MLSNSSKTHEAFFATAANEVTGSINKKYYGFKEYFSLKQINKQLADENARLKNQLLINYDFSDTSTIFQVDSLQRDTLNRPRKYTYLPAKVVGNSVISKANYMMLERGSKQGVQRDMSVVSPQGIVGIVSDVSENYSKVMSVLHSFTQVSAMLQKSKSSGVVYWDGIDPHYISMKSVSKSANVKIGDTVITSTYSSTYPSGIMIGTVVEVKPDPAASFNTLKLKTATNFFNIQHVYLIKNYYYTEQNDLSNKKDTKIP
jgi:rod shape-determining protein MreC